MMKSSYLQQINQTMLSNQRAYADLYVRLMSADVEREKSQHTIWRKRLEDWKRGKTDMFVEKFRYFWYIQLDVLIGL